MLALDELCDGGAEITLVCPDREFIYRPQLVLEPFGAETAIRRDLPALLAERNGRFVEDRVVEVAAERRTARTAEGDELAYDYALIAVGARMRPAFTAGHTLWIERSPITIDEIVDRGAESGRGLDLIAPSGVTWTLPLYEFALMAERRIRDRGQDVGIRIITPEQSPLAIFGPGASSAVSDLLEARGIEVSVGAHVADAEGGALRAIGAAGRLTGYPVALPTLEGIPIAGLPHDEHGFVPIDQGTRVRGVERVFAAGDGVDFPVKQGGIATEQADAAAEVIAHELGAPVDPKPFHPVLRGKLLIDTESVHMRAEIGGGAGEGIVSSDYLWWPPHKVAGRYLAPWLEAETLHAHPNPPTRLIDVEATFAAGEPG